MIQSGYNPQGGLNTQTQGPAMPSLPGMPGGLPFDPSAAIRERLAREAEEKAYERSIRERAMQMEERRAAEEERRYREQEKTRSVEAMRSRNSMSNREAPRHVSAKLPDYGPTPASFGRLQMNHTGNWGTFVDPANIPVGLQDKIMGGMYGGSTNWDSSNPSITGPQQLSTGKYHHSGGGGGGASIGGSGEGYQQPEDPMAGLSPYERAKMQQVAFSSRR